MPLYEFACATCEEDFEELVLGPSTIEDVTCPTCGGREVEKKISTFASKVAGGSSSFSLGASSGASCSPGGV
jgi:putative FmdB family regulatory protein